jgi:chromosome segregation ATPase
MMAEGTPTPEYPEALPTRWSKREHDLEDTINRLRTRVAEAEERLRGYEQREADRFMSARDIEEEKSAAEARAETAEDALREIRDDDNPFTGKHAARAVAIARRVVGDAAEDEIEDRSQLPDIREGYKS